MRYKIILILVLILGIFLYFYRLGNESLITDEYFSLYVAGQSPSDILVNHQKSTNPNTIPPLYVLILHYWLKIFGISEFAQRSLSAILGILSIYLIYRLSFSLFDIKTGVLSALFGVLSFSWFWVFRQNRCYSLLILLSLISFYMFFNLLRNKKNSLLYLTVVNTLLIYTHYFSFLIVFLQLIFAVFEFKRDKKKLLSVLFMCLIVAIAYLPWYRNMFYDIYREPLVRDRTYPIAIEKVIFDISRVLFDHFHFHWNPLLTIVYLPFIVRGFLKAREKFRDKIRNLPIYLALIVFIPLVLIYSFLASARIRYYAAFMFPLLIFLAYGIKDLNIVNKIKRFLFIFMLAVIVSVNICDFIDFFEYSPNEEWRRAAEIVKQTPQYEGKENIFIFQTRYNPPVFYYYYLKPSAAKYFIDNIVTKEEYERDLLASGDRANKVYNVKDMKGQEFFKKLDGFSSDAWIWIFRYHDRFFADDFRMQNENRYFFHQIVLNKELPQIDMFLIKKIEK